MNGDFRIEEWLIQPQLNCISADGATSRLEPKVMGVLVCLAERAGEVVTKETLLDSVWADTFVTEQVLKVSVSELRKALGDDAKEPRFIQTIPKRGYRLIGRVHAEPEVDRATPDPEAPPASRRLAIGVVVLAALVLLATSAFLIWRGDASPRPIASIAVLPLADRSEDRQGEYFADGMTDALIAEIVRLGSPRVISRTSIMQYRATTKPLPEIARELGVDAILEGSVTRSNDRVRIIVTLVDATTDRNLWSASYERSIGDVLALQSEVAFDVARHVAAETVAEALAGVRRVRSVDPNAYDAYLKGRFFWNKRDQQGFEKAVEYFHRAVEADPRFAEAHTGLADAYNYLGLFGYASKDEVYPKAKEAALSALELDSVSADAHAALAFVRMYYDWDWRAAEESFGRALALEPQRAVTYHWIAGLYSIQSRHEEALAAARRAQSFDPLSSNVNSDLCWTYYYARRYDDAVAQCRRTLELDPAARSASICMQLSYLQSGRPEAAIAEMEEGDAASEAFAKAGTQGLLRWALTREEARVRSEQSSTYLPAVYSVLLGEHDRALTLLEDAVTKRESWAPYIPADPGFDALRSHPRFRKLVEQLGLSIPTES